MPAIQYRNADGKKLKGVTTILNILAKPALIYWGYMQGMNNFERLMAELAGYAKMREPLNPPTIEAIIKDFKPTGLYDKRDKAADAGTLAHAFIENHLKGIAEPPRDGLPRDVIEKAESCYIAYLDWEKAHSFKMLESEKSLVSEEYQYGGTIDIGAVVGEMGIVDLKTSKDIYFSMWVQVAAYKMLWNENFPDSPIKSCHILRLGEDGSFDHKYRPNLEKEWEIFKACLTIQRILDETGQKL